MDAHLFRRFCDALIPRLCGARVEKIQAPAADVLTMTLYMRGRKRQLCLRYGRREPFLFLTETPFSAGTAPPAAVMRLRKHAAGRRVESCVVQYWRRRLWLLLGNNPEVQGELVWLLLGLREGPELHFLPLEASPDQEDAVWPAPDILERACRDWRDWPVLTPALRRTLAALEEPERQALLEDLRHGGGDVFLYGAPQSCAIMGVSAWPLPAVLRGEQRETGEEDAVAALERAGRELVLARLVRDRAASEALPGLRHRRKLERLLQKLEEEERRLAAMCGAQADALALQENLWRWPGDCRMAALSVPGGSHGPERILALDARHTLVANMKRLFHTAKRGKRGLAHLSERRRALLAALAALQAGGEPVVAGSPVGGDAGGGISARNLPGKVQRFISGDGFVLLRGRDAAGNQAVRKLAAPHDIWLHVADGPGAHVVIRRDFPGQEIPVRTLEEAGGLAACKSWQKAAAKARVLYAEARHVKPMRSASEGTMRLDRILGAREVPVDHSLEERLLPPSPSGAQPIGARQAAGRPSSGQSPAGASRRQGSRGD